MLFLDANKRKKFGRVRNKGLETIKKITDKVAIPADSPPMKEIEALLESEKRFRTIAETASDAIIIFNSQEFLIYWNKAAKSIFGYQGGETIGKLISTIIQKQYLEILHEKMNGVISANKSELIGNAVEMVGIKKDRSEFPIELSLSAWKTRNDTYFTFIIRDITERKHAEHALSIQAKELARSNQELIKAKAEAELASRAKSDFLARMSHEIRTPMNGIIGMTSLLLDTPLNLEQKDYANTIRVSADALLQIINDILDISKIESGKVEIETLDFNFRSTMEEVGDLIFERAYQKGLDFSLMIDPQIPSLVKGDPGRIKQILINLAGNAVKFTSKGEVNINTTVARETDRHVVIRFDVTDNGIGIPPDRLKTIFEPFSQVDATITRKFGGTGLGLSISKQLVELMKGRIGVESQEGRGSNFWFSLELEKQAISTSTDLANINDVKKKRVLIVSPHIKHLQTLSIYLRSWGVLCQSTDSAAEAMPVLKRAETDGHPFDMIILDNDMPDMNGERLGRSIKGDPIIKDTIMIAMTSLRSHGDTHRMKEIGFSGCLRKPVKQSHLYDCLVTAFSARKERAYDRGPAFTARLHADTVERSEARILVAEDNTINQKLILRFLEKLGYSADLVQNGREAVKALEDHSYAIVLMDLQMPQMDGIEATACIRDPQSKVRNNQVPIIAVTASAMKEDRRRCLEMGMDDFLDKPVDLEKLRRTIEKYVKSP